MIHDAFEMETGVRYTTFIKSFEAYREKLPEVNDIACLIAKKFVDVKTDWVCFNLRVYGRFE